MPTQLSLDDALVHEAMQLGHHRTAHDAVEAALRWYIRHHKQSRAIEIFGPADHCRDHDERTARRRNK